LQYELSLAHVPGQRGLALLFRVMSPWTHDADPTRALDIDQTLQVYFFVFTSFVSIVNSILTGHISVVA
jgi:hypothetical protein